METADLKKTAAEVRKDIIKMLGLSGSGHPGGSLSSVELLVSLYFNHINYNPKDANDPKRDYFILSKGHVCPVLYAVLAQLECIPKNELCTLRKAGSRLQGHPAKDKELPGIEISTGSLGYGLSIAAGAAVGIKRAGKSNRVYVLMGDGEQQEGSVWEAAMSAAHFKLDNLCAVVDDNGLQIDGPTKEIMNVVPLADKYKSFGWNVIEINGHNFDEIDAAYVAAKKTSGKPTVIIAKTVKGKGVSFMENLAEWHGKVPSKEQVEKALAEIDNSLKN
ncbi:transketolase [Endomicrobium proavitum]|uniref:Putative transketolase N-terminal section n=1 Tax=Endomicrobium proavitum TaxID=1408281 RepID=A0A0G3WID5_9BACT|nr:transketolase [Endomicrobium proavitum]AKL97632.1 putative transketolase N-terminal section [Endomicrobium proavitum]